MILKIVKKDNIISDIINVINILICSLSHVLEKIKAATVDRVHKFTGKQRKSKETYNPNAHSLKHKKTHREYMQLLRSKQKIEKDAYMQS